MLFSTLVPVRQQKSQQNLVSLFDHSGLSLEKSEAKFLKRRRCQDWESHINQILIEHHFKSAQFETMSFGSMHMRSIHVILHNFDLIMLLEKK